MIEFKDVSCVLITKDPLYPKEIIDHITQFPFGEILILTNCDSPYRKQELFEKTKYDTIYYQDDDAICPIQELFDAYEGTITCAMKPGHIEAYKDSRIALLGWGSIFPKTLLQSLKKYTDVYGEDDVFKRETERILTYFNYPQNRLDLPIVDLPSAWNPDRLSFQSHHYQYREIVEERCKELLY